MSAIFAVVLASTFLKHPAQKRLEFENALRGFGISKHFSPLLIAEPHPRQGHCFPAIATTGTRSLFSVAPPMNGLDVFRMVIAPGSAHSFRVSVVWCDVATVDKFLVTDSALSFLLDDFSIQQLPHLCGRPKFAKSSRVVWIFDALNAKMKSALLLGLLTTAAEQRPVYWAVFISTKLHKNSPVRVVSISGSLLAVSRRAVPSCSQTPIAQRMRPE